MAAVTKTPGRPFALLEGVLPIDTRQVPLDIIAGITLAALAIPEVMGYTKIAGMPVVTGLYTILIPMALFAIFGASRHLVVGADSATAAIMAAGLVGMAAIASPQYVALAGLLAILTGVIVLLARIIKLGFLADFLSRTVLIGFLTGVGIQVAIGQISGMLGISGGGAGTIQKLVADIQQLPQINPLALAISLVTIVIIVGMKRITRKIPGALIAVIGMIILSWALDLQAKGVAVLGPVPGGLPHFGLPQVSLSVVPQLLATAFSMFIVILTQSAATSRAYAAKYDERFSENTDLIGLTLANIGAGLSGTFVVNGSPTKTQMVDGAGGRSQLAQIITTVVVLLVLLFLTGPLAYMPDAVLAAVVFLIGIELVDLPGMRTILAQRPAEFWVALVTAATVIFIGVEQGILFAILLSLVVHTRHGYRSRNTVLVEQSGHLRPVPVTKAAEALPGLILYRFNHSMYYANSDLLASQVLHLLKTGPDPVTWLCIDMIAVDDVDFTAAATLRQVYNELHARSARLVFADASDHVRKELDISGIAGLVGKDAFFDDSFDVIEAYRKAVSKQTEGASR
jgi:sulfate permease, SulP family